MSRRNVTSRILLVFAVVAGVVDALLFAIAIGNLTQGPSPLGYDFLASANHAAALVAAAAAAAAISKIKTPLFAFLEANGWTHKKGLFG